jgi:hypothetical protein
VWPTATQKPECYSQACWATGENHDRAVLRQLLGELDLGGVLIQADALHIQRPFSAAPGAEGRLLAIGQGQPEDAAPPDPQPVSGKAQDPFVATDHEISHRRNITWSLRAKQAPEHIREAWAGTSWIVEVTATGRRDGASSFSPPTSSSPACAPHHKRCCNWFAIAGALKAGTGSVTPSSTRMPIAAGAMAPEQWPRCELQLSTCCDWRDSGRFALVSRR